MKARKIVDEMDSYVPGRSQDEFAQDFILKKEDIIYKYNGVVLDITTQQIPYIVKVLIDEKFSIYSIYELYTPEL